MDSLDLFIRVKHILMIFPFWYLGYLCEHTPITVFQPIRWCEVFAGLISFVPWLCDLSSNECARISFKHDRQCPVPGGAFWLPFESQKCAMVLVLRFTSARSRYQKMLLELPNDAPRWAVEKLFCLLWSWAEWLHTSDQYTIIRGIHVTGVFCLLRWRRGFLLCKYSAVVLQHFTDTYNLRSVSGVCGSSSYDKHMLQA